MNWQKIKPLVISLLIPLVGGFLSNLLSGDVKAVYESLTLPYFAPPAWVFAPVWILLYLMLGFASYLVWRSPENDGQRTRALTFYAVQMVLNFIWSPVFFGAQQYRLAFWILCAMIVLTFVMLAYFAMQDKRTLWLIIPYIAWLLFAAALNRAVITLNP